MRPFLIIKWILILAAMAVFCLFAAPLLVVANTTQPYQTRVWLKELGEDHARRCRIDFLKADQQKDYGLPWIVAALMLLAVFIYWRTLN